MSEPNQEARRIPTADDRLERAKSTFAMLTLLTSAFAKGDDVGGFGDHFDSWAWHRLSALCQEGYRDIEAVYGANLHLDSPAPDVEVK